MLTQKQNQCVLLRRSYEINTRNYSILMLQTIEFEQLTKCDFFHALG